MPEQITTLITDLFLEKGLVLVILSFMIGQFIKNSTSINNKHIPVIVAVLGAVLAVITNPWTVNEESLIMAAVDGFMIGGFTPGLYEMLRESEKLQQYFSAKKEDTVDEDDYEEEIILEDEEVAE